MKLVAALLELAGLGLVTAGLWQIWAPLAYIGGGVLLVLVAQIVARRQP